MEFHSKLTDSLIFRGKVIGIQTQWKTFLLVDHPLKVGNGEGVRQVHDGSGGSRARIRDLTDAFENGENGLITLQFCLGGLDYESKCNFPNGKHCTFQHNANDP